MDSTHNIHIVNYNSSSRTFIKSLPNMFFVHFSVLNKSLLFNDIPMEYVTDCPASASDLPAVATSLVAISDPGANLILKSFSITSSLALSQTLGLNPCTDSPMRLASLGVLALSILSLSIHVVNFTSLHILICVFYIIEGDVVICDSIVIKVR